MTGDFTRWSSVSYTHLDVYKRQDIYWYQKEIATSADEGIIRLNLSLVNIYKHLFALLHWGSSSRGEPENLRPRRAGVFKYVFRQLDGNVVGSKFNLYRDSSPTPAYVVLHGRLVHCGLDKERHFSEENYAMKLCLYIRDVFIWFANKDVFRHKTSEFMFQCSVSY